MKNVKIIEIRHEIEVDECLAKEIEELNNIYGIVTSACCCGHGDEKEAFIAIDDNMQGLYENVSVVKMHRLGYKAAHEPYYYLALNHYDSDKEQMKELPAFIPKSKCKCKKIICQI